uniref:Uncharacterized protein n=1 Tax=Arundo donax TaxID=35708 RepID=A0A0A9CI93_ARUDO
MYCRTFRKLVRKKERYRTACILSTPCIGEL